jgi:hypothetical protein
MNDGHAVIAGANETILKVDSLHVFRRLLSRPQLTAAHDPHHYERDVELLFISVYCG